YEQKPRWRDLLSDPERLQQIGLQAAEQLAELMQLLNSLIVDCVNLGLPVLLERVINRTGLLHQIMAAPDRSWQLQVVKTFFDFVRRETDKQPRLSLQKLLDMLDNMDANRLPIRLNRQIHAGEGVHLITAHSSKGLEFRYVFMIDGVKDFWEPARSNRARKFTFPDTITLSGEEDAMEARRRLFYVAMTRAKEHLLISYALKDHRGKNLQRVQYIDEILQKTALKITPRELTAASMEEAQLLLMLEPEQPTIPTPGKEEIEEILKNFVLSISSLNTFLRCPLSFFYEYILRVPVTNSEAAAYGTAMHFALRRIFEKMRSSKQKELPDVEQFRVYFREELRRQGAYFTDKGFARRMELGERYLAGYYEQHKDKWSAQVLVEYNIRQIEVQGAPVAGTVDRIDLLKEQRAHIVDYKTGSLDRGKLRAPSKANPHGGNYWRQLLFYKTLYESFQQDRLASSLELSYLEPDHKGQFQSEILEFSQEQVQWMKGLIADSYQKIRAHQFYTGCGEVNCNWCNFVKNRETIDSFADVEKEELDDSH
ncbi:MAG: PD-(D/E)XK nuclease family protein, partial [Bacteroidota bacterium]